MVWWIRRSRGVLVRARFHIVFVDYNDEYEMKSMINRYQGNCNVASSGCSNIWWQAGTPDYWSTRSISAIPYISLSVNLMKLLSHIIFIIYCLCGIVTPNSVNTIPVIRCAQTSMCDSNNLCLVTCRYTGHLNCERIRDIHWIYSAE